MTARHLAKQSLALFAFALFWMKQPLTIGGLPAFPSDLLFLIAGAAWLLSLGRSAGLRFSAGFWPLLLYFAALAVSTLFATDIRTSAFKLATEAYLITLPVLVYNLVDTWSDLKRIFLSCIAGATIVAVIGAGTVLLFPLLGHQSFLAFSLHHYGTLPPGPYPRLEVTFEYPAMMANYLALALMLLILSKQLGWLPARIATSVGVLMLVTALFALTPGFGGLLVVLGIWFWHRNRGTALGLSCLGASIATCILEVVVAAVTPILHPTAPFLIHMPGLSSPLAPAVRLLAWLAAARTFAAHPLVGCGIGIDPVHVPYVHPTGEFAVVTDAHNTLLSVAAQAGLPGIIGLGAVLLVAIRQMARGGMVSFGLALAFVGGILVQGLVGAFEDARHLWFAYGLMLVARKLEAEMVPAEGFEPPTFGLQNRCTTTVLSRPGPTSAS